MPSRENLGNFPDSFRIGWREADIQMEIASRHNVKVSDPRQ